MGLAETLLAAGTTAITALGNVALDITYVSVAAGTYDVDTDSYASTETSLSVKGIKYKSQEQNQDYKKTVLEQTKILIAGEALASITPKESDYMIIAGVRYEIKEIKPAPVNAVFVFIVRQV